MIWTIVKYPWELHTGDFRYKRKFALFKWQEFPTASPAIMLRVLFNWYWVREECVNIRTYSSEMKWKVAAKFATIGHVARDAAQQYRTKKTGSYSTKTGYHISRLVHDPEATRERERNATNTPLDRTSAYLHKLIVAEMKRQQEAQPPTSSAP